jgi:hypothetical protein
VEDAMKVDRFGVFECAFQAQSCYDNPYVQVEAEAMLQSPTGELKHIPLFWDGGDTWRLRFSPDCVGVWRYRIQATDPGLAAAQGAFECVPSNRHGSIEPMKLHPFHFQYQNGEPFFWMGDTGWRAFATCPEEKLTREAVLHYFGERAAQGFSYIHVELMGGLGQDGQQQVMFDFHEETLNSAFFQEVDVRLQYMNAKNIICGIVLAWANGKESWSAFASTEARRRYARYVVARYSAYEVMFIASGEWDLSGRDTKPWYLAIGQELMDADPHNRLRTIHPCRGYNIREFAAEPWLSFGDYQQTYEAPADREATAPQRHALRSQLLWSKVYGKPVVNAEFAYYLRRMGTERNYNRYAIDGVDKPHSHTRTSFRRACWSLMMAGGYFVAAFGTTYYGGWREIGPFNVDDPKNDEAESDLSILAGFFRGLPWWRLQVDDSLVKGHGGNCYCLAELRERYVVFAEECDSLQLTLNAGPQGIYAFTPEANDIGSYTVEIFDPRSGETRPFGSCRGSDKLDMKLPDKQDWVVLVTRA